jgi:hypothetical protein
MRASRPARATTRRVAPTSHDANRHGRTHTPPITRCCRAPNATRNAANTPINSHHLPPASRPAGSITMCSPPCRFRPPAMALTITMPHQVHNLMGSGAVRSERSVIFRRQCLPVLGRLHPRAQYRTDPGRAHRAVAAHDRFTDKQIRTSGGWPRASLPAASVSAVVDDQAGRVYNPQQGGNEHEQA